MGLLGWMKRQLIDIIECTDQGTALVWRFPHHDNEVKNGAKLIVRPGQVAVFVHEGELGDVFAPGTYTLSTQNIPVLTSLKSWKYGFDSPFRSEVYFVSTTNALANKWGTMNPITLRDADFGMVRLRAYGMYAVKVNPDPESVKKFFVDIVGTDSYVSIDEIEGHLRGLLVSAFTNALGNAKVPALDLAGNYDKIAAVCREQMEPMFSQNGLILNQFVIQNISLPPEVEKAIDTRASMGALGNMAQYTQYQAANAMRESAQHGGGGGMANMAVEMSTGMAMGQMMAAQMQGFGQPMQQQAPPPQQAAAPAAGGGQSVGERLKTLKNLHEQGLIDDATFAAKRDAILAEI